MTTQVSVEGLIQLFSAVILFGSMFVPLKKYDSGDGFFAQWIMSVSILIVGFGVFAWQSFIHFYPIAMLGGCFWAIGNCMAIPVIQRLGMALGILIWNSTNCLVGWTIGTFGIMGIEPRPASNLWLSYCGLVLVFIGGIMFLFVKNKPQEDDTKNEATYQIYKLNDVEQQENGEKSYPKFPQPVDGRLPDDDSDDYSDTSKWNRIIGIIMALISGSLYGINVAPVLYVQDNAHLFNGAPPEGLPYAFSHFFGAFIMCTTIFVIYALVKRNKPVINPQVPIPALLVGLIWGIAQTLLLNATAHLSAAITFPICSMLPGCVASVWSIFYFKEIEGKKNLLLMSGAIFITLCGAICIGASK
uniref:Transmembrane protein 144 n=1 Tax=Panagrolaimus sp. JU765 TaxID=591449 RepID=A0AC34RI27_9BILA